MSKCAVLLLSLTFATASESQDPSNDCKALVMMTENSTGLIWILPGVEQAPGDLKPIVKKFRKAGVRAEIRILDWDRFFGVVANVVDIKQNKKYAECVARDITLWSKNHAGESIDIVGYSGGGGLAVMVAEALPQDIRLRHIILAQPAMSPTHDLTAALRRVDEKLVHFHSPHDWIILHLGTRIFGTIDRKHVASSGKVGLDIEKAIPDESMRHKLEDHEWTIDMLKTGHYGGHAPITFAKWSEVYIAPYLLPKTETTDIKKESPKNQPATP